MMHRIFTVVCLLLIVFHVQKSFAQDELSLDDSFSSEPTTDGGILSSDTSELTLDDPTMGETSIETDLNADISAPAMDSEITLDDTANPLDTIVDSSDSFSIEDSPQTALQTVTDPYDQAENVNLASPKEILKRENALYGLSVGAVVSSWSLGEKYSIGPLEGKPDYRVPNVNRSTAAIQSAGVMLRYAIAPFYSIGTDLNISFMKSQNHSSVTVNEVDAMSEMNVLRAEVNLTYAIYLGRSLPIYFLAGLGAERVTGGTVSKLIQREGYGGQVGMGFVIASKINLEGSYSYYAHRLSQRIHDDRASHATAPGSINMEEAQTANQGFNLRATYNFE